MNKYLLLRDNKQSGPYSANELRLHGLKPYDLVWLEGRSAAWRYPSEIEELRPFAPAVEEQPFDRFYRKPDAKTFEPAPKDNARLQPKDFLRDEVKNREAAKASGAGIQSNNTAKKIHVSLPDPKAAEPFIPKISSEENQDDPVSEPAILETIKPIVQQVPVHEAGYYSNASKKNKISEENFEESYRKNKPKESVPSMPYPGQAPVSKLLFRTVAAVCLLLGGALIGLIINYNSQQKKFQQLNQLVQEIRHKENPGTSKSVKKENISDEAAKPKGEATVPPVDTTNGPVYKEDIQLPVVKKERKEKKPIDSGVIGVSVDTQVKAPNPVPPVLNDEAIKKAEKQLTELARKNLWQLVSVDNNPYKTGVFGGVSNLALKLSNKSLYQLEQVEVEVLYLSPENKTVNTQKVIFENVAPGEQLTINVPKSGRGVKIDYSIKKINTKEFGLAHSGM
jgi:hypothetical protein